jgi:hypothetical protein
MRHITLTTILLLFFASGNQSALAVGPCTDYKFSQSGAEVRTITLPATIGAPSFFYLIDELVVFLEPTTVVESEDNRFRNRYLEVLPISVHTEIHAPLVNGLVNGISDWQFGGRQTIELVIRSAIQSGAVAIFDTDRNQFVPEIRIVKYPTHTTGLMGTGGHTSICFPRGDTWRNVMRIGGPIS